MKIFNKSIFQMNFSKKLINEMIQGAPFKNFLKDYHKIDLNQTTRFRKILHKNIFEKSDFFKFLIFC